MLANGQVYLRTSHLTLVQRHFDVMCLLGTLTLLSI